MLNRDGEMVSWQIMENQRRNRNRKIWKNGKADEEDEEMESWKSKRADDRMHKISFHALTKYVTLENMANSPIQNIKCFPNK